MSDEVIQHDVVNVEPDGSGRDTSGSAPIEAVEVLPADEPSAAAVETVESVESESALATDDEPSTPSNRHPVRWILAAATVVALAGGGYYAWHHLHPSTAKPAVAASAWSTGLASSAPAAKPAKAATVVASVPPKPVPPPPQPKAPPVAPRPVVAAPAIQVAPSVPAAKPAVVAKPVVLAKPVVHKAKVRHVKVAKADTPAQAKPKLSADAKAKIAQLKAFFKQVNSSGN